MGSWGAVVGFENLGALSLWNCHEAPQAVAIFLRNVLPGEKHLAFDQHTVVGSGRDWRQTWSVS